MMIDEDKKTLSRQMKYEMWIAGKIIIAALLFGGAIKLATILIGDNRVPTAANIAIGLLPALPISWWVWIYARYMARLDELQRLMEYKTMAIAVAVTFWGVSVWGALQRMVDVPQVEMALVAPYGAMVYGLARLYVGRRYK